MSGITQRLINKIQSIENPNRVGFLGNGTVRSYWDSNGYAIGWGSRYLDNGAPVQSSTLITVDMAEILLLNKLNEFGDVIDDVIKVPLNQNQFEALLSLVYNIGPGAFRNSTLAKVINQNPNNFQAIEAEFKRWVYVNGQVNSTLQKRRAEEFALYAGAVAGGSLLLVLVVAAIIYFSKKKNRK